MQPIKTDRSNFTYRGPTPDIMDLPCERTDETYNGHSYRVVYSVWELTDEERAFIARGGNLKLGIIGMEPIPPVSLQVVQEGMHPHGSNE